MRTHAPTTPQGYSPPAAAPGASPTSAATGARPARIDAVDIVRGLAVVLMAIDHVRVYSAIPAGGPAPDVFFTRWVTHFVAPVFVFLAGTAAWLYGSRVRGAGARGAGARGPGALASWLAKRGLLLVVLELTVIRFFWTFGVDYPAGLLAGVIWMLGWCMVLLALLVRLPLRAIAAVGIAIVVGHNLVDFVPEAAVESLTGGPAGLLWQIVYFGGYREVGAAKLPVYVLYSLVPWIGVMACGYALGPVAAWPAERRRAFCLKVGAVMVAAFVVLRALDVYGDPSHWRDQATRMPAALAFLATAKYPASLLFLLMTLGPSMLLLGVAERLPGAVARVLRTFGRVPMFYYLLHIPLIHALAVVVSLAWTGRVEPWLFLNHPAMVPPAPEGWRWPMWLLYLVTTVAVAILWVACRWYERYKARHRHPLLSYL